MAEGSDTLVEHMEHCPPRDRTVGLLGPPKAIQLGSKTVTVFLDINRGGQVWLACCVLGVLGHVATVHTLSDMCAPPQSWDLKVADIFWLPASGSGQKTPPTWTLPPRTNAVTHLLVVPFEEVCSQSVREDSDPPQYLGTDWLQTRLRLAPMQWGTVLPGVSAPEPADTAHPRGRPPGDGIPRGAPSSAPPLVDDEPNIVDDRPKRERKPQVKPEPKPKPKPEPKTKPKPKPKPKPKSQPQRKPQVKPEPKTKTKPKPKPKQEPPSSPNKKRACTPPPNAKPEKAPKAAVHSDSEIKSDSACEPEAKRPKTEPAAADVMTMLAEFLNRQAALPPKEIKQELPAQAQALAPVQAEAQGHAQAQPSGLPFMYPLQPFPHPMYPPPQVPQAFAPAPNPCPPPMPPPHLPMPYGYMRPHTYPYM